MVLVVKPDAQHISRLEQETELAFAFCYCVRRQRLPRAETPLNEATDAIAAARSEESLTEGQRQSILLPFLSFFKDYISSGVFAASRGPADVTAVKRIMLSSRF